MSKKPLCAAGLVLALPAAGLAPSLVDGLHRRKRPSPAGAELPVQTSPGSRNAPSTSLWNSRRYSTRITKAVAAMKA